MRGLERLKTPGNKPESNRFRLRRRDGSYGTIEATGKNMLNDPIVKGMVLTARDISEQSGLENQLRQSQKMETLGKLAGGIAHDFNDILTGVLLRCQMLLDGNRDWDAETAESEVAEIKKAGERAAGLTRQLLTFSRQDSLETATIDVNEIISETQSILARTAGDDIAVIVELSDRRCPVRANKSQLEQILLNPTVNACDAMERGGRLTIRSSNVTKDLGEPGAKPSVSHGYVRLEVSDTGCGMDSLTLERLFEPFFTTKPLGKGTGLGLSTFYGAVQQCRDEIRANSTVGEGTTFVIDLPID